MTTFSSPLAAFLHYESTTPDNLYLKQLLPGETKTYTYAQSGDEIRRMATALRSYGLEAGDKVAVISKNCAHWIMSDIAIAMAGCVSVPLYPTLGADSIQHILEHSESKVVILGKLDDYESQKPGIPANIQKIGVGLYDLKDGDQWEDLIEKHSPMQEPAEQKHENLLTIMYTSGTTGLPKGVMHTVGNFAYMGNMILSMYDLPKGAQFFSYLPLSHVAERLGIGLNSLYRGATVTFPQSLDTFADDLSATQPHLFFAVPRIWSKFQEKILMKLPQKKLDTLLKIPIIKNVIKKKLKTALGLSRAEYIYSGAAPIAVSLQEWFMKIDVNILQGYGMTEDGLHSHFCFPEDNRFGTVGKLLPEAESKFTPEGELLLKSKAVMTGYYKMPDKTAECFTEDGFLRTGDLAEYDHEGHLMITGRAKDLFKTDKGKYIAPTPIELELMKNPDIEQVCVVGVGIPQPIALIVTSEDAKNKSNELLATSIADTIAVVNPTLEKHEKLEKAVVMKEDWTVDNNLLTPTMKVKRNQVEKIHMPFYPEWFGKSEQVIFEN